ATSAGSVGNAHDASSDCHALGDVACRAATRCARACPSSKAGAAVAVGKCGTGLAGACASGAADASRTGGVWLGQKAAPRTAATTATASAASTGGDSR